MTFEVNTVVIGAGHAGLNTSRALQKAAVDHVVFEKGQVGHSWRTQRWDSFRNNTPAWVSTLLDDDYAGDDPGEFFDTAGLVGRFEDYVSRYELPVRQNTSVDAVERDGDRFVVRTSAGKWRAANVIVCSGLQNVPVTPSLSDQLPTSVTQMHAADYRSPDALSAGAVLVVGSAQTGSQIAEELAESGRTVHLCTSKVARVVRRYRGRDILDWMMATGMAGHTVADLPDPAMQYSRQGVISGTKGGHTLSLQHLGRLGVTLLGRLEAVDGTRLVIGDDLAANVAFGDGSSAQVKGMVDAFISGSELDAEPAAPDPAEAPFPPIEDMATIRELDLERAGISTVIWATGFRGEFSYLDFDIEIDSHGFPAHDCCEAPVPGLYYVGFPWLRTRISGLIAGAGDDALHVSQKLVGRNAAK